MTIQEEMHSLAQAFIGAYETRVTDIGFLRGEVASLRQAAQAELQELDRAHNAMARELRGDLARGGASLAHAEDQRKSEVRGWVRGMAKDHAGAREEWQHLVTSMRARRSGGTPAAGAPEKPGAAPVAEAHEKRAKKARK